jgi:hypothetical protein
MKTQKLIVGQPPSLDLVFRTVPIGDEQRIFEDVHYLILHIHTVLYYISSCRLIVINSTLTADQS